MKHKLLRGLPVLLSLVVFASIFVFAAGGGQHAGLNLLVQQIRTIGARQWLALMAGSVIGGAPVIAPLTERIAHLLPGRAVTAAGSGLDKPA